MATLEVAVLDVVVDQAEVVAQLDRGGTRQRGPIVIGEGLVDEQAQQGTDPLPARPLALVDAQVVGEHLVQRPGVPVPLAEDDPHLVLDLPEQVGKLGPDVHLARVPDLMSPRA